MMNKKRNLTKLLLCGAVVLLILASAAFCGMARVGSGASVFSFLRSPRYQDDWRLMLVNETYAVPEGHAQIGRAHV